MDQSRRTVRWQPCKGEITSSDGDTHLMELHADRSQMDSGDTCSAAENDDKDLVPADGTLIWQRTTDEYGELLMLRQPDTGFSASLPMQ